MKKLYSILLLVLVPCFIYSQNTTHLNEIENYLQTERFENRYTFHIDTVLTENPYTIYSITPYASSFSSLIIFKNDSIVNDSLMIRDNWNRMPYNLITDSIDDRRFVSFYWHGSTTSYTAIYYFMFELCENIELKAVETIYYFDKHSNAVTELNSIYSIKQDNKIILLKKHNDVNSAEDILNSEIENSIGEVNIEFIEIK